MSTEHMGFLYAVGAAITWGLVYAIDQKILSSLSPFSLLFVDSFLAAVIMLPFVFFGSDSLRSLFSSGWGNFGLIVLSLALATLANFFIFSSIKTLGASTASIIEIAYPFFVVLFSYLFFQARLGLWFVVGAVLIFIGSAIIIRFGG